jgi:hypothetical protein
MSLILPLFASIANLSAPTEASLIAATAIGMQQRVVVTNSPETPVSGHDYSALKSLIAITEHFTINIEAINRANAIIAEQERKKIVAATPKSEVKKPVPTKKSAVVKKKTKGTKRVVKAKIRKGSK